MGSMMLQLKSPELATIARNQLDLVELFQNLGDNEQVLIRL